MELPKTEYSDQFDIHRKNRVAVSMHKYGSASVNFGKRIVNTLPTMQKCIDKYNETHNTEYLCDAANYLMFEYMYPSHDDAFFKATDSGESAGIDGISIKEMEAIRNENY